MTPLYHETSSPDAVRAGPPPQTVPEAIQRDIAAISGISVIPKILQTICRATGMGFSAVARVTDKRWIACAVRDEINFGLKPGGELELQSTICDEIRQSGQCVVIDHVTQDPHFKNHHTPAQYGFQSYISVPLYRTDGSFFGTLCAIDPKPALLRNTQNVEMFHLFADLITQHLDAHQRVTEAELALERERAAAAFRDRFIAVLGHDLRNPLAAIHSSGELLALLNPTDDTIETVSVINRSVERMTGLIENVLDFARGKLGGGLPLTRVPTTTLQQSLEQVIAELQSAHPGRTVIATFAITRPITCDTPRLGQLLSNLLANALTHGSPAHPVLITAATSPTAFTLTVSNHGPTIPATVQARLFEPFVRGSAGPSAKGLGLGLYIASEIAAAHNGTLTATSADGKTCFTFQMPLA